jgi:hypothetical protein
MTFDEFRRQRVFVQHCQRAPHPMRWHCSTPWGGCRAANGCPATEMEPPPSPRFSTASARAGTSSGRPSRSGGCGLAGPTPQPSGRSKSRGAAQLPESDNPPEAMRTGRGAFGLSADAAALFCRDTDALALAAGEIAESIMPDTRRDEVLAAVFGEQELPSGEVPAPDSPTALQPHRRGPQKTKRSAIKRSPTKRHRRELESKLPTTQRGRPMKPEPLPSMRFRLRQVTLCNSCENWLSWHSLSPATGERPISDRVRSSGP